MHSLETELHELHAAGVLDRDTATLAIARERGTVFSVLLELRIALYAAIAMITTGIGLWVRDHLDRIGPATIILTLALLAIGCYATAIRTLRLRQERSLVGDYVLLLGALLVSLDLGYVETQYHWLGDRWSLHLLLLSIWHAATAYLLKSRLVLSVSLISLAAWFGLNTSFNQVFDWQRSDLETGMRALSCAAIVMMWRYLHRRSKQAPLLLPILEHFAINLAFWGAISWCWSMSLSWPGFALTGVLAAIVITRGLREQEESYIIYGVAYAALGACIVIGKTIIEPLLMALIMLTIIATSTVVLWRFHQQLKHGSQP